MRTRLILAVSLAAVAALDAQAPQERGQPTFRSGANYVRVDMYATRDGTPVNDLKATDIEVLEDGVPQKVEDFEHVVVRPAGDQQFRNEPRSLTESRAAAADPRARVFVIFLDTYHTQTEGSTIMRKPLVSFLDRVLGDDDLVALMTPEMAGSDIALGRKTEVISKIVSEEWWGRRARVAGQDPEELKYEQCIASDFDTVANLEARAEAQRRKLAEVVARRREKLTLDALEDLMTHLAGLRDERKAVVVVTEGWMLYEPNPKLLTGSSGPAPPIFEPPVPPPSERGPYSPSRDRECERDVLALATMDSQPRFRTITEEANRGNVTFYPVYAKGLASFDAPIGPDKPPSVLQDMANLRTRHSHMRDMAAQTDGTAIIDTNYIAEALKRIADDLSSYYLFGYYSTNSKLDGRFRSITVRVKQPNVRVRARRGYRARTAAQVAAAATTAAAVDAVRPAVLNAMNAMAGISPRSTFRVRSASWMRNESGSATGTAWVVGELEFRMMREPAWAAGATADVMLLGADGTQLSSTQMEIPAGQSSFSVRVPAEGRLTPGDYAVRVRLRGRNGDDSASNTASDTARVVMPERPSPIGEAVMWRRGTSTGPQYVKTADPRYQRSDRMRLELPTTATSATARLLDRAGKILQVPVQVSVRTDAADGLRWIVADLSLAPLAAGDYAIEVTAGEGSQVTGFRIVP